MSEERFKQTARAAIKDVLAAHGLSEGCIHVSTYPHLIRVLYAQGLVTKSSAIEGLTNVLEHFKDFPMDGETTRRLDGVREALEEVKGLPDDLTDNH